MKWVSVKERLPEPDSLVLVAHAAVAKNTIFAGTVNVLPAYFSEDKLFLDADMNHFLNNGYWEVTHWMLLPDPPDNEPKPPNGESTNKGE